MELYLKNAIICKMVIDLPYQIQNIPSKPVYAVIEQRVPNRAVECNPTPLSKQRLPDPEHFGGYITTSGTAQASLASETTQKMTNGWIPWEGKIPSVIIQLDYLSYLLEIKPELRTTSQNSNV